MLSGAFDSKQIVESICNSYIRAPSGSAEKEEMSYAIDALIYGTLDDPVYTKDGWDIGQYHDVLYLCSFGGEIEDPDPASSETGIMHKFNVKNGSGQRKLVPHNVITKLCDMGLVKLDNDQNYLTLLGQTFLERLSDKHGKPNVVKDGFTIPTAG